jgi:hypothetical protein
MARARNIKPGFYKNEDLAECSVWARLIFPGLWMLADREGRLEDRPKRIKAELLPFDGGDMDRLLAELHARGFLVRYQNADGKFIQITKFHEHQSPHYSEKQSVIKPPILPESSENNNAPCEPETPGVLPEYSRSDGAMMGGSQRPSSLNPSSLIPDSLIPSSLNPEKVNTSCPEPSDKPARSRPAPRWNGATVCLLPVVAHAEPEIPITQEFVDEMQRAYPAVDVAATLPEIRAWCVANPSKRKTPSGVYRFVQSWLSREQNRG